MQTSIVKWGNSQGVRLPKFLLETVNMTDNDKVEITTLDGKIIIKKATKPAKTRARKSTAQRIAEYEGDLSDYVWEEWDTGRPVGEEIW